MTEPGSRTCVDPVDEAVRVADALRTLLDAGVEEPRPLIEAYIRRVSVLGFEVTDDGDATVGRAKLLELQEEFADRLGEVLGVRVIPPPLRPFVRERLSPVDHEEVVDALVGKIPELVAQHYVQPEGIASAFRGSDLATARIIDCRIEGVNFSRATFGPKTQLLRTRFVRCTFDDLSAEGLRGSSLFFEDCTFNKSNFTAASIADSVFAVSDRALYRSEAIGLATANLTQCVLAGLDFPRANISAASFTGCRLDDTSLSGASAGGASFCESTLIGCDLGGDADFRKAYFRNCDLRGASFGGDRSAPARLKGADLTSVFNLSTVALTRQHEKEAVWPDRQEASADALQQLLAATAKAMSAAP